MENTKIRWATDTWNPMTGCTQISPGCDSCYAKGIAEHFGAPAFPVGFQPQWKPQKLALPRRWKTPRRVFVNSMSDFAHRDFSDGNRDAVMDVMTEVDRHQYLILTKRPKYLLDYVCRWLRSTGRSEVPAHIWLGTSIESDAYAWRADVLRRIPVPIRFISAEPLLGTLPSLDLTGIAWMIVGGESGRTYRPMDDGWARALLAKAREGGSAFFFKQHAGLRTAAGVPKEQAVSPADRLSKVEYALYQAAISGNVPAILFYLTNKAGEKWSAHGRRQGDDVFDSLFDRGKR